MRKFFGAFQMFFIILWSFFSMFPLLFVKSVKKIYYIDLVVWPKGMLFFAMIKVKGKGVENLPKDQNFMFMANHTSFGDIPILNRALRRPVAYFAKAEIQKIPIMGKVMTKAGMLFVDRSNPRKAAQSVVDAVNLLKSGKELAVFPEGTRSKDGKLQKLKSGGFQIAAKANVPIVPVYIEKAYKHWGRDNLSFRPGTVEVNVLPPVYSDKKGKERIEDLHVKVEEALQKEEKRFLSNIG